MALYCGHAGLGMRVGGPAPGSCANHPHSGRQCRITAARVSFIALPIAALLLSHGLRRAPEWRRTAGVLYLFMVMIMVSLIVFFASLLPISGSLSPPMLFGLTERMLLAVYAAWLCAAAIGLLRSTTDPAQ